MSSSWIHLDKWDEDQEESVEWNIMIITVAFDKEQENSIGEEEFD